MSELPLLVVVEAEALVQPVMAWLTQETASGKQNCVGKRKVTALAQGGRTMCEVALLEGVQWLVEHTKRQLEIQVTDMTPLQMEAFMSRLLSDQHYKSHCVQHLETQRTI